MYIFLVDAYNVIGTNRRQNKDIDFFLSPVLDVVFILLQLKFKAQTEFLPEEHSFPSTTKQQTQSGSLVHALL